MSIIGCTISQGVLLQVTGSGSFAGTQFMLNGPGAAPSNGIIPNQAGGPGEPGNTNALEGFATTTVTQQLWNAWTAQNNPSSNQNALMASGAIFVITP